MRLLFNAPSLDDPTRGVPPMPTINGRCASTILRSHFVADRYIKEWDCWTIDFPSIILKYSVQVVALCYCPTEIGARKCPKLGPPEPLAAILVFARCSRDRHTHST